MSGSLVQAGVSGSVAHLRLTNSRSRNAIGTATVEEAIAALNYLHRTDVSVGVFSADAPVFCAGNDLTELDSSRSAADFSITRLIQALLDSHILWVAAVNGPALGGGMALLAVCPLVVVSESAWFALPEADRGLFPSGVAAYLEVTLGSRLTLDMGLTGRHLTASEAVAANLAREAIPSERLEEYAHELATKLSKRPTVTAAAREAWQAHFRTDSFLARQAVYERIFRESQPAARVYPDTPMPT